MNSTEANCLTVPLGREAHAIARQFAAEQATPQKGKQTYLNTLAVYAVHSYLKWLQIDTDLGQGDSWHPLKRALFDVADLVLPGIGKIECRLVLPGETTFALPLEVAEDRIGYVAVQFSERLDEVQLLGFVRAVAISHATDQILIADLQPLDALFDCIPSHVVEREPVSAINKYASLKDATPRRILLIEDNDLNRQMLDDYLVFCGYQVLSLADGSGFFQAVQNSQPHLILLKVESTKIDGYTLLQQLQQKSDWRHIPVIVFSASASQADRERALSLGARRCLVMPVSLRDLEQAIQDEWRVDTDVDEVPISSASKILMNLSGWLQNTFSAGWQTVEALLNAEAANLALSTRSAEQLREIYTENSATSIRGGKLIDLGMQLAGQQVVLIVKLTLKSESEVDIRLRVYPAFGQIYLPPNLQLMAWDESGTSLQTQARSIDNWIQLEFSGEKGERFSAKVSLGDVSVTEDFVI